MVLTSVVTGLNEEKIKKEALQFEDDAALGVVRCLLSGVVLLCCAVVVVTTVFRGIYDRPLPPLFSIWRENSTSS